jgi:microcin C transport system substrate-binding protein
MSIAPDPEAAAAPGRTWTRRLLLAAAPAVATLPWFRSASLADQRLDWRHAISLAGPPRYAPDVRHFDYVNPQAPKGGRIRVGALGTFDNLNPFISGVKGNLAAYLMTIYETLLMPALDETTTEYGLLAEAIAWPDDQSAVAFRLRPEARWHDGRPVSAEDVVFSFETWKRLSPQFNRYYQKVSSAVIVSEREVRFAFSEGGDPSLPLYVGQMPVLPRHWWLGIDAKGNRRDPGATTLEPPLGSGPYRLGAFTPGRSVVMERVPDYWGQRVPARVGNDNFDRIEVEYYRDANVLFEAFKADRIDFRRETSLKNWAVGYATPAVAAERIVRDSFPIARISIAKAFVFNQRRPKFADVRVRRALALAYSFADANRQSFYGLLAQPGSYFPRTDFEATGTAPEAERALFASLGHEAPDGLWAEHKAPVVEPSQRERLYTALSLLKQAGWRLEDGRLVDARGEQLTVELLLDDAAMERVANLYADGLDKLGIVVQLRLVDDVQYQNRLRTFDFDIIAHAWVQGHAPGNEQREYWSSESASRRGTNNMAGLTDPLIDALVEKLVLAADRPTKETAGRLLDRVLRAKAVGALVGEEDREFCAWWNRFGRPDTMPRYGAAAFPNLWWWDEAKARRTGGR